MCSAGEKVRSSDGIVGEVSLVRPDGWFEAAYAFPNGDVVRILYPRGAFDRMRAPPDAANQGG